MQPFRMVAAAYAMAWMVAGLAEHGHAQQKAREFGTRGVIEVGGSVGYNRTVPVVNGEEGYASSEFSAIPYAGVFLLDGLEVGVNPAGISYFSQAGRTTTQFNVLGTVGYNLRTQAGIFPFIEALGGWTSTSTTYDPLPGGGSSTSTVTSFSWGGRGGMKVGIAEHALLNVGAQYLMVTQTAESSPSSAGRFGTNELTFTAGFTVWF